MIRILIDLFRWTFHHARAAVCLLAGEHAYTHYLEQRKRDDPSSPMLSPGAFHARRVEQKWARYVGCGAVFTPAEEAAPDRHLDRR